jgi:PAS domain S-box-containing protein
MAESSFPSHQRVTGRPLSDVSLDDGAVWALLDAAPDGMFVVDRHGRMVFANSRAETLFGYDRAELLGQTIDMLLPVGVQGVHRAHRVRFAAEPTVRAMGEGQRLVACRADGSEFPVEIALSPVEIGGVSLTLASVRDVSDRLAVEAFHRHIRHVVDSATDGVYVATEDLRFEYVNHGAVEQSGYSRAELLTMTPLHLTPELTANTFDEVLGPLVSGEVAEAKVTTVLRRKDGTDFPTETFLTYPASESGSRRLVAVVRDISERVAVEAERERIYGQLVEVLDAANVRVRRFAPDGTITLAEGTPAHRFGPGRTSALGVNVLQLASSQPETLAAFRRGLAGERFEATAKLDDGRVLRDIFRPVFAHGEVVELGVVSIDMTELAHAQAEAAMVRAAIDRASEGIAVLDTAAMAVLFFNRRFATELGLDGAGPMEVAALVDFVSGPEDRMQMLKIATSLKAGEMHRFHVDVSQADGTVTPFDGEIDGLGDGLVLVRYQDATDRVEAELESAVDQIDDAIKQLRTSIFATTPSPHRAHERTSDTVRHVVAQSGRVLANPRNSPSTANSTTTAGPRQLPTLTATLRECLSNIAKHADATAVTVTIRCDSHELVLEVADNGKGPPDHQDAIGNGLANLAVRAEQHQGTFTLTRRALTGSIACWAILSPQSTLTKH